MERVLTALAKVRDAERELVDAVRTDLPGGAEVSWWHGEHRQRGFIVDHGYGGRVLVENDRTGGRRWITPAAFVRG